jgi:hypothetical protein
MDHGQLDAAIRLGTLLSLCATVLAVTAALAGVPQEAIVLAVIVVGFVASWVLTGRIAPVGTQPRDRHRVTVIALPHRVG